MSSNQISQIRLLLSQSAQSSSHKPQLFFKTDKNEYAAHDKFIGVKVPTLRKIAKEFSHIPMVDIQKLLESVFNEERLLALILLVTHYQKAEKNKKEEIYRFYLKHIKHVNNWNLVDSSAHFIIGAHLYLKDKDLLLTLAQSKNMWERRIAIVATWYFIRKKETDWTFTIAKILLNDSHDLIHKAVGWMLREAGKKEAQALIQFLMEHKKNMPRTMLRYAIEKFPEEKRKQFLS